MSYFLSGWSSKYPSPKPKRNSGGKCQLSSCLYGIKFGEAGNPLSKSNFIKTSSKNAQKRCMAKLFLVSLKYKYTRLIYPDGNWVWYPVLYRISKIAGYPADFLSILKGTVHRLGNHGTVTSSEISFPSALFSFFPPIPVFHSAAVDIYSRIGPIYPLLLIAEQIWTDPWHH